jgi:Icc-related predicted phosphoesterase
LRIHYVSDLHLESQDFPWTLPSGDVLVVAGDLCHAACLAPARVDPYAVAQRDRVLRFADAAARSFRHVVLVAGNHDHYDGVFEETAPLLRRHLAGFTVLDDDGVDIDGVRFFGATLWSDFKRRDAGAMQAARRGCGEFFFVKTRAGTTADAPPQRFRPDHAADAFDRALAALCREMETGGSRPLVVVTHHAPSTRGLNPRFAGGPLDGAYASDLDALIERFEQIRVWIHGHTHVVTRYAIGRTAVVANCRGFDGKDRTARAFSVTRSVDL